MDGNVADELPHGMPTTVFVSDPSAETERIAGLLRSRGYLVVDVPLSMLVARVAVQRPRVLLVDADSEGALDTVARMREIPEADGIDLVYLGKEGGAIAGIEDAIARDASGFFARPVDVPTLMKKIEALTGGPSAGPMMRPSTPPPSVSSASLDPAPRWTGSLSPAGTRDPSERGPALSRVAGGSVPRLAPPPAILPPLLDDRRPIGAHVSEELEQLLQEAEQRIGGQIAHDSVFPTPEEEIEAVLPPDVLAALDEPIDDDDDDDDEPAELGAHTKGTTSGGGRAATGAGTTGGGGTGSRPTNAPPRAAQTEPPAGPKTHGGTQGGTTTGRRLLADLAGVAPRLDPPKRPTILPANDANDRGRAPGSDGPSASAPPPAAFVNPEPRTREGDAVPPPPPSVPAELSAAGLGLSPSEPMPSVLAPGDAARIVAHAIVTRATGALCVESQDGVRRAVLREGDLVTAASGVDSESLLSFLVARGDLSRDSVQHLLGKLPPFGRHAGAALVAHGHLQQDQLWSVLRAHAEWVLGRILVQSTGTAVMEAEPPGRLRGEPSVFGGSTGAEVFVEVVRRVVAPGEALARLGGPSSRIGDGDHAQLLDECALDPGMADRVRASRGAEVQTLIEQSPGQDAASVIFALQLLGVIEMVRAVSERRAPSPQPSRSADSLDEEAVRARVRARLQLVDEGDYFTLLGVSRDATSYEVKRAFLELRRAFEPARILTPQMADLSQDVRKIASVLDEAYEILRDSARRERYRRAIEGPRASSTGPRPV